MVLHLNGESFKEQPLQPFGTELTPVRNAIAFQPWLRANVGEISEFVRDKGLVVLTQAVHADGDEWLPIEPVQPFVSTCFPHVDRSHTTNGPSDSLGWMLLGEKRSPTAFVPGKILRNAMVEHREVITKVNTDSLGWCGGIVKEAQECLMQEDWIHDTLPIQSIAPTLHRERRFELMLPSIAERVSWFHAVLNWAFRIPHTSLKERIAEQEALAKCEAMLAEFQQKILGSIEADTYKHDWSAHPHSAVLAWNNPSKPSVATGDYVAHFATSPDPTIPQSNLGRLTIHNGQIVISAQR